MSWPDLGSWTLRSPQKTHNRAEQVGMHGPKARPGARHMELPCAGTPARAAGYARQIHVLLTGSGL